MVSKSLFVFLMTHLSVPFGMMAVQNLPTTLRTKLAGTILNLKMILMKKEYEGFIKREG